MNLAVFGATGATGRHILDQALAGGHTVTALVRSPAALPVTHEQLQVLQGDVREASDVTATIVGQDAVLIALGAKQRGPVSVCGDAVANILPAMTEHGVQRLVALSAYGVADSRHCNLYTLATWTMVRQNMVDKERMEALIRASDVGWTIVRPPALRDGPRTGCYRTGTDLRMTIASGIRRADLADFMLSCWTDGAYTRETPAITSGMKTGARS